MWAERSRPGSGTEATKEAFAGAGTSVAQHPDNSGRGRARLRVGPAVARIRLDRADDPSRAIQGAVNYPPGTRVVLVVAPRQPVVLAVDDLREYGLHLGRVDVECSDSTTAAVWRDALTTGVHSWVDPIGGAA